MLRASQLPSATPLMITVGAVAVDMVPTLEGEAGQPGLGADCVLTERAQIDAAQPGHRPPRVTFPPAPQLGEPVAHLPICRMIHSQVSDANSLL